MLPPAEVIANTPDHMCWLCRREIEMSRPGKFRGHRPSICRIITFYPSSQTSTVSGIGYRVPTDAPTGLAFTVPRRISASLTKPPLIPEKVDMVTTTGRSASSPQWTFPVHADCWGLLTSRVHPSTCATILCKALITLNWDWSFPSPLQQHNTNNYSLPRLFLAPSPPYSKTYHRRASLQQPQTFYGLAVELGLSPLDLSPISNLAVKLPSPQPLSIAAIKAKREPGSSWDVFSALPPSIIPHILCFVHTSDIRSLRFASRTMSRAAQVDALPQTFWRSRFWPEHEMGFAAPEDAHEDDSRGERDWNGLYFAVKEVTRKGKRSSGADGAVSALKKRMFWWDRLGGVVTLCEQWKHMRLKGEVFSWVEQLDREEGIFLVLKEVGCVSALMSHSDGTPRESETVCLPLDWCGDDMEALGISIVDMAGQKYVSGLRMFLRTGEEPFELGYPLRDSEFLVHFHPGEFLFGFRVRVDDDAVRALKVISQTPLGRLHVSPWIGNTVGTVGKRSLEPTSPTTLPWEAIQELPLMGRFGTGSAIVASFDDFRMMAFGVAELIPSCD
ncbi:hypothetical protein B0T14DRAFT_256749 [Immersiella caudata]|uniref:DUF7600 domain-containing protein n=1 Tax=Immersiella caudata TaxID=314043 RepID=A0AA40BXD6_9PEZI|nr:hypothetical protein B0T14DRAFT_256749 [Immersiella caudata]